MVILSGSAKRVRAEHFVYIHKDELNQSENTEIKDGYMIVNLSAWFPSKFFFFSLYKKKKITVQLVLDRFPETMDVAFFILFARNQIKKYIYSA